MNPLGNATSSQLASVSYTSTGTGLNLDFIYDGFSTIALFFGATNKGWPFPTVNYDNIHISSIVPVAATSAIPEPAAVLPTGLVLTCGALLRYRRRTARA